MPNILLEHNLISDQQNTVPVKKRMADFHTALSPITKKYNNNTVTTFYTNDFDISTGVSSLPVSQSGRQLPNARSISLSLFPDKQLVDPIWNLNAQQWGQIITHDMSLTAGVTQSRKLSPMRLVCVMSGTS